MSWTRQAKKDAVGKWIKFDEEHPSWTMTFTGDPAIVDKVSTMGDRKGEHYNAYEFPVIVDGEEKILSVTQRSLLRQLIEEEEEEPLPGRTLTIKCLDIKTKKEWKIREVKGENNISRDWAAKDKDKEDEASTEEAAQDSKEETPEHKKFMEGVKEQTKKNKTRSKKKPKEETSDDANGSTETSTNTEAPEME